MAVLISTFIFAQTNVSGIVVDEDNNPIPGANIVFDSTTGAVANFDGCLLYTSDAADDP